MLVEVVACIVVVVTDTSDTDNVGFEVDTDETVDVVPVTFVVSPFCRKSLLQIIFGVSPIGYVA